MFKEILRLKRGFAACLFGAVTLFYLFQMASGGLSADDALPGLALAFGMTVLLYSSARKAVLKRASGKTEEKNRIEPQRERTDAVKPDIVLDERKNKINPVLRMVLDEIVNGKSMQEIARKVSEATGIGFEECIEQVSTVSSAYHNVADMKLYRAAGIEYYEFMAASDERVCRECYELDGKHFKISEAKIGVNYPPMHLGCRCCTVSYDPDDEADMIASGITPPAHQIKLSYEDFREHLAVERKKQIFDDSIEIVKTTSNILTFLSRYQIVFDSWDAFSDKMSTSSPRSMEELYFSRLMMCIKRAETQAMQLKTVKGQTNRLRKMIDAIAAHNAVNEAVSDADKRAVAYLSDKIAEIEATV